MSNELRLSNKVEWLPNEDKRAEYFRNLIWPSVCLQASLIFMLRFPVPMTIAIAAIGVIIVAIRHFFYLNQKIPTLDNNRSTYGQIGEANNEWQKKYERYYKTNYYGGVCMALFTFVAWPMCNFVPGLNLLSLMMVAYLLSLMTVAAAILILVSYGKQEDVVTDYRHYNLRNRNTALLSNDNSLCSDIPASREEDDYAGDEDVSQLRYRDRSSSRMFERDAGTGRQKGEVEVTEFGVKRQVLDIARL